MRLLEVQVSSIKFKPTHPTAPGKRSLYVSLTVCDQTLWVQRWFADRWERATPIRVPEPIGQMIWTAGYRRPGMDMAPLIDRGAV